MTQLPYRGPIKQRHKSLCGRNGKEETGSFYEIIEILLELRGELNNRRKTQMRCRKSCRPLPSPLALSLREDGSPSVTLSFSILQRQESLQILTCHDCEINTYVPAGSINHLAPHGTRSFSSLCMYIQGLTCPSLS